MISNQVSGSLIRFLALSDGSSFNCRFDGLKMMEMLRDKRLMFVGDSVQRGMFESMVCLVQSAIPNDVKTSLQRIPPRKVFKVEVRRCHTQICTKRK